jgi:transposase-like protein
MENAERARQMFEEGASDSAVARELGISPYKAKQLRPGGTVKKAKKKKLVVRKETPAEESVSEQPVADEEVELPLTEFQIDRIWSMLPIEEKALGLQWALTAVREKS